MTIYQYQVTNQSGEVHSLDYLRDKVVIIVNTATGCGFTPHYEALESLYKQYHERGLEILDIPCNQFGNQAPGTDQEITAFCQLTYGTSFPQMKKAAVNGDRELPLYTYLKDAQGFDSQGLKAKALKLISKVINPKTKPNDIKWNFTKFVINRQGQVVARFEPTDSMDDLAKLVEALIKA